MERKSIGAFISALRKSNGMTQKELAEKLCVSDKAVSRWERDESAPDLYLIPVIAEIFGVTSDELLLGKRIIKNDGDEKDEPNIKSEKIIKNLAASAKTKFFNKSVLCFMISVIGFILELILNFAVFRMDLAFFISLIFFAVSAAMAAVFSINAMQSLNFDDVKNDNIEKTKRYIAGKTESVIFASFILTAFSLPLIIFKDSYNVYVKLNFSSWFFAGIIFSLIAAVICIISHSIVLRILIKKDILTYSEEEKDKIKALDRLKIKYVKIFSVIIVISVILHIALASFITIQTLAKGKKFTDPESFKEYMETVAEFDTQNPTIDITGEEDGETHYPEEEILSEDGEVIVRYQHKNQNVSMIVYGDDITSENFEVTVYSPYETRNASITRETIMETYFIVYAVEISLGVILYFVEKKKIKP